MSVVETAECLQISEAAVKTRLHRARTLLQDDLYRYTGDAPMGLFKFHLLQCDRLVKDLFDRIQFRAY